MSLVIVDNDPWWLEYQCVEKLQGEILNLLKERNEQVQSSDAYARLQANIRLRLKQNDSEIDQLVAKLRDLQELRNMTDDEVGRRKKLIDVLLANTSELQQKFKTGENSNILEFASTSADKEPEPLQSISQLRKQQKQLLKEQDDGLDQLSQMIHRQKHIAIKIGSEVINQNEIIDDIADRMERTTGGLREGREQIMIMTRTDNTCGYWLIIIALFVAIVTILFI